MTRKMFLKDHDNVIIAIIEGRIYDDVIMGKTVQILHKNYYRLIVAHNKQENLEMWNIVFYAGDVTPLLLELV